jgi:hypothetical protein
MDEARGMHREINACKILFENHDWKRLLDRPGGRWTVLVYEIWTGFI